MTASPIRIVFFGDSICYGQLVPPHLTWVTRISAKLRDLALQIGTDRPFVLSNSSINGNTTRMALERMPYDVQSHGLDLCVVQFGLNDCNCWASDRGLPRVSAAAFAANLHEIADRARRFGARRIVFHTNHPTTRDREPMQDAGTTFEASNRRYNGIVRAVAAESPADVTLHDIEAGWTDHIRKSGTRLADLLLPDGVHLSEAGHELYFDLTWPNLESIVEREFGRRSTQA
jgi:acyl-CoA thioesterase I